MTITIQAMTEGINEKIFSAIEESIQYFGFYSGMVEVDGRKIDFWRDNSVKESIVLKVADYKEW